MSEKDMVLDILSCVKGSISSYAKAITECSDLNLRQTLQQMRNSDEQFQYELYKIAEQKGYYVPSPKASTQDAQTIKTKLTQSLSETKSSISTPVMS